MLEGHAELEGFDPLPQLVEVAPTIRAAAVICTKDGYGLAAIAGNLSEDAAATVALLDALADLQGYLRSLREMVANAELRLLAALAD
jgi:hypothetical protein